MNIIMINDNILFYLNFKMKQNIKSPAPFAITEEK